MADSNPLDVLSVVPGIGSVAANLIGNSQNVKLAREQREHDLRMWTLNNQYNYSLFSEKSILSLVV